MAKDRSVRFHLLYLPARGDNHPARCTVLDERDERSSDRSVQLNLGQRNVGGNGGSFLSPAVKESARRKGNGISATLGRCADRVSPSRWGSLARSNASPRLASAGFPVSPPRPPPSPPSRFSACPVYLFIPGLFLPLCSVKTGGDSGGTFPRVSIDTRDRAFR